MGVVEGAVSVIIPTRNRLGALIRCLESVLASSQPPKEVIVVDDHSNYDVSVEIQSRFPAVKVIRNDRKRWPTYCRNIGGLNAEGDFLFFIDDDNVVDSRAILELMERLAASERIGAVAPVIYYLREPKEVWTHHIGKGLLPGFYYMAKAPARADDHTYGFHDAYMVKRTLFRALGGLDYEAFPIHHAELDFYYRMREAKAGAVVVPEASVWHDIPKKSMRTDPLRDFYVLRNVIILLKRHYPRHLYYAYILFLLPVLTGYSVAIRLPSVLTKGKTLALVSNILRGIVSGLVFPPSR